MVYFKLMQGSKDKAVEKGCEGKAYFLKSNYAEAVTNFCEGLLLLPQLDMYAKERSHLYWGRAECYLRMV